MARYIGSVCRLCRREGMKLFLKGDRCFTEKCAIEKRNYAPGQHGKGARVKSKLQGYGLQLREKQKAKRLYRLMEGQCALTFDRATQDNAASSDLLLPTPRHTGECWLCSGGSRGQPRQLVRHGHVRVNEKKLNIPSFPVRQGDVVSLGPRAAKNVLVLQSVEAVKGRGVPKWLELDATALKG